MRSIDDLLHEHPFFAGLDSEALTLLAGCAANRRFNPGDYLYREGTPAETFYVIRHGRVAIEAHDQPRGAVVIETMGEGEVLGWSWLIPPHRWMFDARAVDSTRVVVFDGTCLRAKCDEDPRLGYAILKRVAAVMFDRLQGTRVRLLDLYGVPGAPRD